MQVFYLCIWNDTHGCGATPVQKRSFTSCECDLRSMVRSRATKEAVRMWSGEQRVCRTGGGGDLHLFYSSLPEFQPSCTESLSTDQNITWQKVKQKFLWNTIRTDSSIGNRWAADSVHTTPLTMCLVPLLVKSSSADEKEKDTVVCALIFACRRRSTEAKCCNIFIIKVPYWSQILGRVLHY